MGSQPTRGALTCPRSGTCLLGRSTATHTSQPTASTAHSPGFGDSTKHARSAESRGTKAEQLQEC